VSLRYLYFYIRGNDPLNSKEIFLHQLLLGTCQETSLQINYRDYRTKFNAKMGELQEGRTIRD